MKYLWHPKHILRKFGVDRFFNLKVAWGLAIFELENALHLFSVKKS